VIGFEASSDFQEREIAVSSDAIDAIEPQQSPNYPMRREPLPGTLASQRLDQYDQLKIALVVKSGSSRYGVGDLGDCVLQRQSDPTCSIGAERSGHRANDASRHDHVFERHDSFGVAAKIR